MLAVFLYLFFMYFCIDKSTKNARSMSAVGFAKGSAIEALTAAEAFYLSTSADFLRYIICH